jgi:hypothetical protein
VQLYIWAKWITGPYFVRSLPGRAIRRPFMKVILVTWTSVICLGFPVGLYYFIIKPWRRERRITTDGMLMVSFGLLFFQDPLLNYFNTWSTVQHVALEPGFVGEGHSGMGLVGQAGRDDGGAAPHERARLLVRGPLCTMLGCWVMRRAKSRWPSIGTLGLLGVVSCSPSSSTW